LGTEDLILRTASQEIVYAGLGNDESWIKRERSIFKQAKDFDTCRSFLANNLVLNWKNGPNFGNETSGPGTFAGYGVSHK